MNKTKDLISNIQEIDFLSAYKVERCSGIKIKLLALHHLQNGKSAAEVADITLYMDDAYGDLVHGVRTSSSKSN